MQIKTVAFVNWQYPAGGAETVTRNLGRFLLLEGCRIVVYAERIQPELLSAEDRDFTIHPLPIKPATTSTVDADLFCRSLAQERVDCLIVQGNKHLPYAEVRRRAGCRIVFCLHGEPLYEVKAMRNRRACDLEHATPLQRLEFLLLRKPVYRLSRKLERRTLATYAAMLPHLDRMVMLCEEYRDRMAHALRSSGLPGSDAPGVRFLSMSNPLPSVEPEAERPKEKIVLFAGRLSHEDKRVDRLLRIWRRVERHAPDWRLILLGSGDEAERLGALARRLKLKRAEFAGHVSDPAPYYRRAAFICLTSSFEGFPMCLIEAQRYGTIPVSFDSFAAIHAITDGGRAGIVVPAFHLRRYARKLLEAMHDEELQQRLRARCYRLAPRYDIETIGRSWLELFRELEAGR